MLTPYLPLPRLESRIKAQWLRTARQVSRLRTAEALGDSYQCRAAVSVGKLRCSRLSAAARVISYAFATEMRLSRARLIPKEYGFANNLRFDNSNTFASGCGRLGGAQREQSRRSENSRSLASGAGAGLDRIIDTIVNSGGELSR